MGSGAMIDHSFVQMVQEQRQVIDILLSELNDNVMHELEIYQQVMSLVPDTKSSSNFSSQRFVDSPPSNKMGPKVEESGVEPGEQPPTTQRTPSFTHHQERFTVRDKLAQKMLP
jgi:hypothetical protein